MSIINVAQKKDKSRLNVDSKGYLGPPPITSCTKVQEEADRVNFVDQSVISTKAGVFEAITNLLGSNITNAILYTADRSDHKRNNDYMLFKVMQAAIDGVNRPPATDVFTQLLEAINFVFNFRKKISGNMEGMQALKTRIKTHGIQISTPQISLTLMANNKVAAREDFGLEFRPALQTYPQSIRTALHTMTCC